MGRAAKDKSSQEQNRETNAAAGTSGVVGVAATSPSRPNCDSLATTRHYCFQHQTCCTVQQSAKSDADRSGLSSVARVLYSARPASRSVSDPLHPLRGAPSDNSPLQPPLIGDQPHQQGGTSTAALTCVCLCSPRIGARMTSIHFQRHSPRRTNEVGAAHNIRTES